MHFSWGLGRPSGVPCPPWARGGAQQGINDPRGRLWVDTLETIVQAKPKAFLLENVAGLLDLKFKVTRDGAIFVLHKKAYYLRGGLTAVFDGGEVAHGVWSPPIGNGHWSGCAFVSRR